MSKLDLRHKQTLQLFLPQFFELFLPELAPFINFSSAKFLDKELADIFGKEDTERHTDALVLVEMEINGHPQSVVIHWEQQSSRQANFEERMFRYFCGIYFRYGKPVLPIALFTDSARWHKITPETFQLSLHGKRVVQYEYYLIKLKRYTPEQLLELGRENPLVWAYLPLTDYKAKDRPRMKARAFGGVARLVKDGQGQATLFSLINRSVELDAEEQKELKKILIEEEGFQEVRMLQSIEEVGFERGIEQGFEQGIEQGFEQGIEQGFEKGIEQGFEKGKILGQLEDIRGLLENGVSWDVIQKATGITPEKYEALRREYLPEE